MKNKIIKTHIYNFNITVVDSIISICCTKNNNENMIYDCIVDTEKIKLATTEFLEFFENCMNNVDNYISYKYVSLNTLEFTLEKIENEKVLFTCDLVFTKKNLLLESRLSALENKFEQKLTKFTDTFINEIKKLSTKVSNLSALLECSNKLVIGFNNITNSRIIVNVNTTELVILENNLIIYESIRQLLFIKILKIYHAFFTRDYFQGIQLDELHIDCSNYYHSNLLNKSSLTSSLMTIRIRKLFLYNFNAISELVKYLQNCSLYLKFLEVNCNPNDKLTKICAERNIELIYRI